MRIGIIGGSGIYDVEGLEALSEEKVETPFGNPSDAYIRGALEGREVFFLPRHARGHLVLPSEINHRANIFGFKKLGVDKVISFSAVGSLKEELRPGDLVLPDQYFDRTKRSVDQTFFGDGIVAHVGFGDPTCAELREQLVTMTRDFIREEWGNKDVQVVGEGTYVNMEGPAFSTRAESEVYRKLGFDVIGMTSLAEAKLCREAGICYQSIALVTDYDCWRQTEESVSVDAILEVLQQNSALAKALIRRAILAVPEGRTCGCGDALKYAVLTAPDAVTQEAKDRLGPIIGKYVE